MSGKLHVVSLGCTKNLVDTEVMMGRLKTFSITDNAEEADVIIVNTCGFIDAAKQESINTVLSLHDVRKKDSILVMTGCLTERYREELSKELPEIDIFTGVGDYAKIDELLAAKESRFSEETYLIDDAERVVTGSSYHAYIKISEGCNQACSFCAIPSFKGKLQSRPLEQIKTEVSKLVEQGFYDFSFISQDSSSFMRDLGENEGLIRLIESIEAIKGVKSARILYLYPSTTSKALIERIGSSEIFQNYFDMPIQHISDKMLKIMKRGFGKEKTVELLELMKAQKDAFIRTSFIVGHPGEEEADFDEMLHFVQEFGFDRVNVFEYSQEEDTSAFSMEQIDDDLKAERAQYLGEVVENVVQERLKALIGKELDLVVEGESDEHEYLLSARPLNWAPEIDGEVFINDKEVENIHFTKTYRARITDIAGTTLLATVLHET